MNEKAAQLDAVIQKNVASVGARYVDTLEAFDGHELCSGGREYVNGLTRRAVAYSFHPSAPGQAQLAESAREAVFWP